MITTGYFANTKRWTKVHLIKNGKPLCGSIIGDDMETQFCANYRYEEYIECEKCKKL